MDVKIKPNPLSSDPIKHVVVTLVSSQHLIAANEDKNSIPDASEPTQAKKKNKIKNYSAREILPHTAPYNPV